MHRQRTLLLLASLTAAGCPGPGGDTTGDTGEPAVSTGSSDTGASAPPTSGEPGPTSTGPGETGTVDVTTGTTGDATTGADATTGTTTGTTGDASTGTTGGDTTDGTATDTETTGVVECEPSWTVPEVAADELAKHDLQWIGCEFTACGPDDAPLPGEPSLLCAPFAVADAPLEYLGAMHINDSGAFTTDQVVSAQNFAWLHGVRHIWRLGERVYVMTQADGPAEQLEVYFAVRALELMRTEHPETWDIIFTETAEIPAQDTVYDYPWKNRLRSVVISFDTSPLYIAAGLTILDAAPIINAQTTYQEYSNVAAISIDRETIRGESDSVGSKPIYGQPEPDANFLRYLREGLVETLVHELLHTRIDRLNSVDLDMNELWGRRGVNDACAKWELEEALVAATSLLHFRNRGDVGDGYLDYYDVVLDQNLAVVKACPSYMSWVDQFALPSGVHERYDLRIVDLP